MRLAQSPKFGVSSTLAQVRPSSQGLSRGCSGAVHSRIGRSNAAEALKHAYADRELDLVRTTEIERHLSGCRACSQAYENIRALSSALKSSNLYFEAPAHLKKRIRASLGAENKHASTLPRSHASTLSRWQWL